MLPGLDKVMALGTELLAELNRLRMDLQELRREIRNLRMERDRV